MALKLTRQEIMKEIVRCGKKPEYFINTYAKITHPMKGLIPFHLYPFQEQLLKDKYKQLMKNYLIIIKI